MIYPTEYRRDLPHIIPAGGTFFVTFRLKGSLPKHLIQSIHAEFENEKSMIGNLRNSSTKKLLMEETHNNYFEDFDSLLDKQTTGSHWLKKQEIAELDRKSVV